MVYPKNLSAWSADDWANHEGKILLLKGDEVLDVLASENEFVCSQYHGLAVELFAVPRKGSVTLPVE